MYIGIENRSNYKNLKNGALPSKIDAQDLLKTLENMEKTNCNMKELLETYVQYRRKVFNPELLETFHTKLIHSLINAPKDEWKIQCQRYKGYRLTICEEQNILLTDRRNIGIKISSDNGYIGQFQNDQFHGQGRLIESDGTTYVGAFKNDQFHGQGALTNSDGTTYVGEFKHDEFDGKGRLVNPDRITYVGAFKDDQFHGQGKVIGSDGKTYVGEFEKHQFCGEGRLSYPNGTTYVGKFQNSELHGQGELTNSDGTTYVGEFKHDEFDGRGTLTDPDGTTHVGKFQDGRPIGNFEITAINNPLQFNVDANVENNLQGYTAYYGNFTNYVCDGEAKVKIGQSPWKNCFFKSNILISIADQLKKGRNR